VRQSIKEAAEEIVHAAVARRAVVRSMRESGALIPKNRYASAIGHRLTIEHGGLIPLEDADAMHTIRSAMLRSKLASVMEHDDDDDFGTAMGLPGTDVDVEAAKMMSVQLPGQKGHSVGDFALRTLWLGTWLSVGGTVVLALLIALALDAWTWMDVSDKLFVTLPVLRQRIDDLMGGGLREASGQMQRAAPRLGPDAEDKAQGGPLMPDLTRADRRALADAEIEWETLQAEFDEDQRRRRAQMIERGLTPPEGVTLPGRARN
jgi:hypothetical protein